MLVQEIARLYACNRCRIQVAICRSCDRGNTYCNPCAPMARKTSLKAARHRYANSYKGKRHAAQRQKRARQKKAQQREITEIIKIVTDQGSNNPKVCDSLPVFIKKLEIFNGDALMCHFCRKNCSAFLRVDFLKSVISHKNRFIGSSAQGP